MSTAGLYQIQPQTSIRGSCGNAAPIKSRKRSTKVCSPTTCGDEPNDHKSETASSELLESLSSELRAQGVRRSKATIKSLADHIARSQQERSAWLGYLKNTDNTAHTDILGWIKRAQMSQELDEALWRGFLAGHFGRGGYDSASRLLCGFQDNTMWNWDRVSSHLPTFNSWLTRNRSGLATLRFGNHRKYESQKPENLSLVITSFVRFVAAHGGTPRLALYAGESIDAERGFHVLYKRLSSVIRFGRTGCFDTLCLLSDLGILPVKPGSCYLVGATGPLKGARKLWGELPPKKLSILADQTARSVGVSMEVFEDALCNWQK